MAKFNYREYCLAHAKKFAAEAKVKVSAPDPTGEEAPLRMILKGSCEATDRGYAELAARQLDKINAKQALPETDTGTVAQQIIAYGPNEAASFFLARKRLVALAAEGKLEEAMQTEAEAANEANEAKKAKKTRKRERGSQRTTNPAEAPRNPAETETANGEV